MPSTRTQMAAEFLLLLLIARPTAQATLWRSAAPEIA
jgi:hypothetical protein